MLTDHTIKFNKLLTPFSFLYGIGVRFNDQLFDWKSFGQSGMICYYLRGESDCRGDRKNPSYGIHHPFDKRPIPGSCTQPWL